MIVNAYVVTVDAAAALRDSGMRGFVARCIVSDRVLPEGRETAEAGLAECERLSGKFASDRIRVVPGFLNYQFVADPQDMQRTAAVSARSRPTRPGEFIIFGLDAGPSRQERGCKSTGRDSRLSDNGGSSSGISTAGQLVLFSGTILVSAFASQPASLRAGGRFDADRSEQSFGPEKNTTFEIGSKNRFLNGRVTINASAYYIDWTDLQLSVPSSFGRIVASRSAIADARPTFTRWCVRAA